ncbi:MAG: SGNH/GDSL hydrolase family protein [Bacteroidota bacterium]
MFFTGMLFWGIIWYIIALIFSRASQNSKMIIHSVFLTILLIEILLRLIGWKATYSEESFGFYKLPLIDQNNEYFINQANYLDKFEAMEFSFDRKGNNLGYRDKEWHWKDMKDKIRILALGDSFTEGFGTHNDSTWLKFLERKLNDTSLYFMNGGITGSDPVFEAYKLRNTFNRFKSNLIIVCINDSDIDDIIIRGGFERFDPIKNNIYKSHWWEPAYAASHVMRVFINLKFNKLLIDKKKFKQKKNKSFAIIKQAMDSVQTYCRNNSAQAIFVFHPSIGYARENINPYDYFIDTLNMGNAVVIDLYEYYQQADIKNNIDKYYWKEDGHHNARGYELMAEGIYEGIKENALIGDDKRVK